MSTSFKDSVVLITGASSGIGAALARELASQGAKLVLLGRRKTQLDSLAEELRSHGHQALVTVADVTHRTELDAAVTAAKAAFGRLDVVVANAGFGVVGNVDELKVEDYRRQFETNVFAVLETIYATLDELKKTRGRLVLVGSVSGVISLPGSSPYSMSKFAIRALAESLVHELRPHGVSVTLISPGFVESEIRRVDNQGQLQERGEPLPSWLVMPARDAAREIAGAIERRAPERIVTFHGKVFVFLKRHFPWLFWVVASRGVRGRGQPRQ